MTVGSVATSAIPWASTWLVPVAKTMTAIAIAPPPTPSRPARKPPLSPRESSSTTVGASSGSVVAAGAEAERDHQPQAEDRGDDRERHPQRRARTRAR